MPRPITQFAVTLAGCSISKESLEEAISLAWPDVLLSYVIAAEHHHDGSTHLHCWLSFKEDDETDESGIQPRDFDSVVANLEEIAFIHPNVQACKSRKSWLKYITKEDCEPLFKNVSPSEFSMFFKINHAAKLNDHSWFNPLAVEHMNIGNVLQKTWEERRRSFITVRECMRIDYPLTKVLGEHAWQRRACEVINSYVDSPAFKQRHVYLFGPPNCGKTTFVMELLGYMDWRPFYPLRFKSPFWLGCLDERYNCIVIDDFREEQFDTGELLCLLQGGWTVKQRKGRDPEDIRWRKPVILTSNVDFGELSLPLQVRLAGVNCATDHDEIYGLLGF